MAVPYQHQDPVLKSDPSAPFARNRRRGWWLLTGVAIGFGASGTGVWITMEWSTASARRASQPASQRDVHVSAVGMESSAPEWAGGMVISTANANSQQPSPSQSGPSIGRAQMLDERTLRERIAAVNDGRMTSGQSEWYPKAAQVAQPEVRLGIPAIEVRGDHLVIRPGGVSIGLDLAQGALPSGRLWLDLRSDEACLVEAPMTGSGLLVDGRYLAPGVSCLAGPGTLIDVGQASAIHIRPVHGPVRPTGSG